jgi:hypothetical protein
VKRLFPIAVFLIAACDPPRERFPGPSGRTTDIAAAQATRAVMGGTDSFGARVEREGRKEQSLSGTIRLKKGLKAKPTMLLFISVRSLSQGGAPLAAKREATFSFPFNFQITEDNLIMQGRPFEGAVQITARLDADGDPLTKQAGDLWGGVQARVGEQNLNIVIDEVVP